ncbi:MAG: hypothetical protein HFF76_11195 [Oscillospiraceae bacterium]|jgi:hypothetical protein|nr:hypothetical protein [Oscillospiraceae bacterium]
METTAETKKTPALSNKVVIVAAAVIVAVVIAAAAIIVLSGRSAEPDGGAIGYAADATVMLDENSLQAAMDEALRNAQNSAVALKYKNGAYSTDGINFECYIANSEANAYDMYLNIYADAEMTDEIFLSQLVPPGSGFESITLHHALDEGDHTVYVVVTQVETDENGQQTIANQVVHTMEFHVTTE